MASKRPREESDEDESECKVVTKLHRPLLSPWRRIARWLVEHPGQGRLVMIVLDGGDYTWVAMRGNHNHFCTVTAYGDALVTRQQQDGSDLVKETRIEMSAPLELYAVVCQRSRQGLLEHHMHAQVDWVSTARSLFFTEDTDPRDVRTLMNEYLIDDVARLCLSYVTGTMGPALDQEFEEWK